MCVLCGHIEKWKKNYAAYAVHVVAACTTTQRIQTISKIDLVSLLLFLCRCVCVCAFLLLYWIEWKCAPGRRTYSIPFYISFRLTLSYRLFIFYSSLERCLFYCFNWFFICCNGAAIYSNWNKGVFFFVSFHSILLIFRFVCFYLSLFLYYGLPIIFFVCLLAFSVWYASRPKPHLI